MAEPTLSEQEMIDILEEIARDAGNGAARIAAIRVLREIGLGDTSPKEGFDALDEIAEKRKNRPQAA